MSKPQNLVFNLPGNPRPVMLDVLLLMGGIKIQSIHFNCYFGKPQITSLRSMQPDLWLWASCSVLGEEAGAQPCHTWACPWIHLVCMEVLGDFIWIQENTRARPTPETFLGSFFVKLSSGPLPLDQPSFAWYRCVILFSGWVTIHCIYSSNSLKIYNSSFMTVQFIKKELILGLSQFWWSV